MQELNRFAVTVRFRLQPGSFDRFRNAIRANASQSVAEEAGCLAFEACEAEERSEVFLYEHYDDRAAFDHHMGSAHYLAFSERTEGWVADKQVATYATVLSGVGKP